MTVTLTGMKSLVIMMVLTAVCCGQSVTAAAAKPDFVIVLADDLGYGDVHANNPERGNISTPKMDRRAWEGMRFTDGHLSSGCCSPSRYTLLTGRYHWQKSCQERFGRASWSFWSWILAMASAISSMSLWSPRNTLCPNHTPSADSWSLRGQ